MTTEMALTDRPQGIIRRFALILAVAGVATFGSVAVAPDASAARPDFTYTEDGEKVKPPAYCDPEKPNKQHRICVDQHGPRF